MRRVILIAIVFVAAASLSGCESWDWKRMGNDTLKGICRGQSNCYATCPDGSRTDPNNPYCPGERPQDQPKPF